MSDQVLSLKALVRALTDAAAYANSTLYRDYTAKLRETGSKNMPAPHPLSVAGMRVSFTANVKKDEHSDFERNGGDLCLDFSAPVGNFKGEIILRPHAQNSDTAYEYDDADFADDVAADEPEYAQESCDAMPGESYESSEMY